MRCPFLAEERIKFCQVAPFRKAIAQKDADTAHETCSGSSYRGCALAERALKERPHETVAPSAGHCPFLQESLALFCSAAPVSKFVPYSESEWSKCQRSGYRYCDLFLTVSQPELTSDDQAAPDGGPAGAPHVYDLPEHLAYSPNHMWIDRDEDGGCHIGIDAFMARVLGGVEQVRFLTSKGVCRPTVVLTVRGVELPVVFPNAVEVQSANLYLRAHPERLITDPYTFGWLFEAKELASGQAADDRLLRGSEAVSWLEDEQCRLSAFAHDRASDLQADGLPLLTDGGEFSEDLVEHLCHDGILCLFSEFFWPYHTAGGSRATTR
jgi:glycine cleavage system H lipoate-binding protein